MRQFARISMIIWLLTLGCCLAPPLLAQPRATPLDLARNAAILHRPPRSSLHEQFIWTYGDAAALNPEMQSRVRGQDQKIEPHFFRTTFRLTALVPDATLYLAGPRAATVYLNGKQMLHFSDNGKGEKGFHVETAGVAKALRKGLNTLAIEEVRGHSSLHTGASPTINQVTYAEVLLVKIVPRPLGIFAPYLVASDAAWKSTVAPGKGWYDAKFDDSDWPTVQTLGVPGMKSDFLQWNADAGLYAWPGYAGIGAAMRTFRIAASEVTVPADFTRVPHPETVTHGGALTVLPSFEKNQSASLTIDFGREINGRIHLVSASSVLVQVETSYGESAGEALAHPYLGVRVMSVPPHGDVFGPKSGFRYVRLTFPNTASRWSRIEAEAITYPVRYVGSFTSSDPVLNRIWETGAYTAHLCMQEDGIWDAPKRDRGRWMGDLDVTGRVISSVFADRKLMEQTMTQVIGESPVHRDVNTIAGYSALWITGQADFYRHLGDLSYLKSMHSRLLELLHLMDAEKNVAGLFTNPGNHKIFVDCSEGFSADTSEARATTHLEFIAAYREAVYLLDEVGDSSNAELYRLELARMIAAAQERLLDPATQTFGPRWQTNSMAVVSGSSTPLEQFAIWTQVLSRVNDPSQTNVITPYYGFYVLSAMASLNHREEALAWMRNYWGGMLDEGATSFWEAYSPQWPRENFHSHLQADNKTGYYVSLAHGWASGPTAWLMQQVLGIEPTARGFAMVTIRPDLSGLSWAKGAEPTPRGLLRVDVTAQKVRITLPPQTEATVSLAFAAGAGTILDNGIPLQALPGEAGERSIVFLSTPGEHVFTLRERTRS